VPPCHEVSRRGANLRHHAVILLLDYVSASAVLLPAMLAGRQLLDCSGLTCLSHVQQHDEPDLESYIVVTPLRRELITLHICKSMLIMTRSLKTGPTLRIWRA